MELAITIFCWIVSVMAFLFCGLCLYTTIGVAFRFVFTEKLDRACRSLEQSSQRWVCSSCLLRAFWNA